MNRNEGDTPRAATPSQPAANAPADVIPDGNLKATIWRNEAESGPFYATSFVRTFRDSEGQFHDTKSFVAADLLRLSELARKAYTRTSELRREDRTQARQQQPEGASRDEPDTARRAAFKQQRSASDQQEKPRGFKR